MRPIKLRVHAFVLLWSSWLFGLQGLLAAGSLGVWTPDLALCLLLGLDARLRPEDARRVALVMALARTAFSADPPAAVLAGYLGLVGITSVLRGGLMIDGLILRTFVAGGASAVLTLWWKTSQELFLGTPAVASVAVDPWPAALTTGLAALLLAPLAPYLPGLRSIRRRR